jgi:Holliday junction resolvase RusA-like endonuclease
MEDRLRPGERMSFEVVGAPAPGGSKTARPVFRKDPDHPGKVKPVTTARGMPIVNTAPASKLTKPWMNAVAEAAVFEWGPRDMRVLDGPLLIRLDFYFPRPDAHFGTGRNAGRLKDSAPAYPDSTGSDLDKLARSTIDALHGIVFSNDRRLVEMRLRRRFGAPARCRITVYRPRASTIGELRELRDAGEPLREGEAEQLALA